MDNIAKHQKLNNSIQHIVWQLDSEFSFVSAAHY